MRDPAATTLQVQKAREVAIRAHAGQTDKLGEPYIGHVGRAAAFVAGNPKAEAVAWLHDVLEDTQLTAAALRSAGLDEEVIAAVEAITRVEGEREEDYLARVSANPLARKVKLDGDLVDNTAPERLARLSADVRGRLTRKYRRYRDTLEHGA